MQPENIHREVNPLTADDCFIIFCREGRPLDTAMHYHHEVELKLLLNAGGAKRMVGDHNGITENLELLLLGKNLLHGWQTKDRIGGHVIDISILFQKDWLDNQFLHKKQLHSIKKLLEASENGVLFQAENQQQIAERIIAMAKMNSFDAILEMLSILHYLSVSRNRIVLSRHNHHQQNRHYARQLDKALEIMSHQFYKAISLEDVAKEVHIPVSTFNRLLKKHTGNTFNQNMNEIRISYACRMLMNHDYALEEVSLKCGFKNVLQFNRIFKMLKQCSPKNYKENCVDKPIFI